MRLVPSLLPQRLRFALSISLRRGDLDLARRRGRDCRLLEIGSDRVDRRFFLLGIGLAHLFCVRDSTPTGREPLLALKVSSPVVGDAAMVRQILEVLVDVELERVLAARVLCVELVCVDELGEDWVEARLEVSSESARDEDMLGSRQG